MLESSKAMPSDFSDARIFTLRNSNGLEISITNFGGKIMSILAPDRNNSFKDIVLGYDHVEEYLNGNPHFGAIIGRFGNRIAHGKLMINGNTYHLNTNNRGHALHGGNDGFHNKVWQANLIEKDTTPHLELTLLSPDGDEGYPGDLKVQVNYTLTDDNELMMDYTATTAKPTVINLTNHAFFNLAGEGNGDVLTHEIKINADAFIPVTAELIPTGEIMKVAASPFDFRQFRMVGEQINSDHEQLTRANGYDHTFVLNTEKSSSLSWAATVKESRSGRWLEVWTTEPGLQFYTGNFLDGTDIGKGGKAYPFRSALCLEAQHFPDSPNQPHFPTTVLQPEEIYTQRTVYKFGVG